MTRTFRTWGVVLGTAALVAAANWSQGGYFSQSWGWIALAFICCVALALILGWATAPGPLGIAFAAALAGLGVWIVVSATWSVSAAASIREAERMLVYVALALALALVLRRGDADALARGVFLGVVLIASYALATRLFPDWLETYDDPTLPYRLAEPIGYWNSLGLLAAMGLLVSLGLVAHGKRMLHVLAGGIALPILAPTLYFTFSRGAWAALAVGVAAMVAIDGRRMRLVWSALVVVPASVASVAVASRQDALTTEGARLADAVAQGHRLAVVVVTLALVSGALALGASWISSRVRVGRWALRGFDAGLVASALAGIVAALVVAGGPSQALTELRERFDAPVAAQGANLNDRLFTVSGNGRAESIRVAWDAARDRPVLGHGAGSYEYLWYEQRLDQSVIRDAHSLYAEMLAELGIVGLALLCLALLAPLGAAVRARHSRFVPAATGAYGAWIAHSAMDWHWEVVGVSLTALLAGGVALLASERGRPWPLPDAARWPLLAATIGLTGFALISVVGNQALFAGREALARRDWGAAAEHARRAESLLIWSFEPQVVLGDAAARSGDRPAALDAYRNAAAADGRNWAVWLRLAQVARGQERRAAYERVHELNPRERDLPGE
ncbi:MAG: O-antigen ligase family protein [Gaiellaceae bacterium]